MNTPDIVHNQLLSPAGGWEAMVAAVQNGADAVYLGSKAFSARQGAENFDDNALQAAVHYCHLRGVRVLVTVNTLIRDREMADCMRLVHNLMQSHVDGIIIQDLGLAYQILQEYPGAPLHASTQMAVHNLAGIHALEDMGFTRVVLARELSLDQIASLRASTSMELEVFIHGALCVSCSGACLMSSMIGGRSGNRGRCAQPCRLPYTLNGVSGYLISPKDLCTLSLLNELYAIGLNSLKIEGRLKRPEYVAIVTNIYRKALDIINSGRRYTPTEDDMEQLLTIFNRGGFSDGYYHGVRDRELIYPQRPNHLGIPAGIVTQADSSHLHIKTSRPLHQGDGVEFRGQDHSVGAVLTIQQQSSGCITLPNIPGVQPSDKLYLTSDSHQLEQARRTYETQSISLPLTVETWIYPGQPAKAAAVLGPHHIEVIGDTAQSAQTRPLTEDTVLQQFSKMGGTPFTIREFHCHTENAYLSAASLNSLRRQMLEHLEQQILLGYHRSWTDGKCLLPSLSSAQPMTQDSPQIWAQINDPSLLNTCFCAGAHGVYLELTDWQVPCDLSPYHNWREQGRKIYLSLPLILRGQDYDIVRRTVDIIAPDGILAPNIGASHDYAQRYPTVGDYWLNIMNRTAYDYLRIGLQRVTLSLELTAAAAKQMIAHSPGQAELIIDGQMALMNLAHCPKKASGTNCPNCDRSQAILTDRKGYQFPLRSTHISRCSTTVYNGQPFCLIDHMDTLPRAQVYRICLQEKTQMEANNILTQYVKAIKGSDHQSAASLKPDGYTTGHYFRGVN